jgi:hypothetical protein
MAEPGHDNYSGHVGVVWLAKNGKLGTISDGDGANGDKIVFTPFGFRPEESGRIVFRRHIETQQPLQPPKREEPRKATQ